MATAEEQPELSGKVLFYQNPEPLSAERHRHLGAKRVDKPFQFLIGTHVVPITVNEFGIAACSYPVIFAGPEKTPLAVMGARGGENVFVNPNGDVDPEVYLPAFARRYPFVFASDSSNENMLVCIDRAAPMIGENPEIPFFEGEPPQPTKYTQDAIEFLKEFERHRQATEFFVKAIEEAGLFEEKSVALTQQDEQGQDQRVTIADYYAISEEKLNALSPEKFQELREKGCIAPAYAHLISLLSWPKIIQRALTIAQAQAQGGQQIQAPPAAPEPKKGKIPFS
jgi:SapC